MRKHNIVLLIMIIFSIALSISGCSNYDRGSNYIEGYGEKDNLNIFLEKGEKKTIDFNKQFANFDISIKKIKTESSNINVFTVKNNKITAVGAGQAILWVEIFNNKDGEKIRHTVTSARVFVIDREQMIGVETAEDLVNINQNLSGNYILKNDIDLKDFGEWQPIGVNVYFGKFSGMFVNPDGFKIKNLSITSSKNIYNDVRTSYGFIQAGLFANAEHAYIDGIILENVLIDVSDCDEYMHVWAGGIVATTLSSTIRNCYVDGSITAYNSAGGIVGGDSWGRIIGCTFKGSVTAGQKGKSENGAGGIAHYSYIVLDCHVEGVISGVPYAGGIVGWVFVYDFVIHGCTFIGDLHADLIGELIAHDWYPQFRENFD